MNRIALARRMTRSGKLLRPLALMVLRPEEIIRYGRVCCYSGANAVDTWSDEAVLAEGLLAEERALLDGVGNPGGTALVLGTGGGRDAIALAQMGFRTIGVDFVPAMVQRTMKNATERGVAVDGVVQEISRLGFAEGTIDLVFLASGMYSCTPTRKRRIAMLKRICGFLREEGSIVCQFFWRDGQSYNQAVETVKRLTAFICRGYVEYEQGDFLRGGTEFLHVFRDRESLYAEFYEGGLEVRQFTIFRNGFFGAALLTKKKKGAVGING